MSVYRFSCRRWGKGKGSGQPPLTVHKNMRPDLPLSYCLMASAYFFSLKYLLPAALKASASSVGEGLGLVGVDLWGGTGGAAPLPLGACCCLVPFVMGTEKADWGWGWACWGLVEEEDGLEGGSTSMALGSLMLERAERRFLSSGGRLSGWVLRSTLLRRDEWPGSVE